MISINIFAENGNSASLEAAYSWPEGQLPAGKIIGRAGNALLMELANGNGVAVISAPRSVITCADEDLPVVDLNWAFK
jgi:hypothetical protein